MLFWNVPLDRFLNYSGDLKGICFESWAILLLEGAPLLAECPSQSPSLQKKTTRCWILPVYRAGKQHTTEKTSNLWEVLMIRSCRFPWKQFRYFEGGPRISTIPGCSPLKPRSYQNPSAKIYVTSLPSGPFKRETTKGSISTDSPHTHRNKKLLHGAPNNHHQNYPQPEIRARIVGRAAIFFIVILSFSKQRKDFANKNWVEVSTHLKNISQNGNLPQAGVKMRNIWYHHLEKTHPFFFLSVIWQLRRKHLRSHLPGQLRYAPSMNQQNLYPYQSTCCVCLCKHLNGSKSKCFRYSVTGKSSNSILSCFSIGSSTQKKVYI